MTDLSKPHDGGPAFPARPTEHLACGGMITAHHGMTLRDWFAGQALAAVFESCVETRPSNEGETWCQMVARESWDIADAMLAARDEPKP